jgi:hypothetical protein
VTIELVLVADDCEAGETTVSTTIAVNTADPCWSAWLVDTVTTQAQEGARRLRDSLVAQHPITGPVGSGFVPLAALVPAVSEGR